MPFGSDHSPFFHLPYTENKDAQCAPLRLIAIAGWLTLLHAVKIVGARIARPDPTICRDKATPPLPDGGSPPLNGEADPARILHFQFSILHYFTLLTTAITSASVMPCSDDTE